MAIEILSSGASSAGAESFSFVVDYDTVAQTIGLTCTGTGHASLTVIRTSNQANLGSLPCDQFGTNDSGAITYDGTRHIALGPGATGVDTTGAALPTSPISAAVVGAFNVPKGQTPGLGITLGWGPNSFGVVAHPLASRLTARLAPSLARTAKRCLRRKRPC